jgi:hypothetical protein
VVRELGNRELPAWRREVDTVRAAMWESVAGDRRLVGFGAQTLALCRQCNLHLNEHAQSRFVAAYGVASESVVAVLYQATAARNAADDASCVFTAVSSLKVIFLPDKTTWTGEDSAAFSAHPSQLILRQGLAALIDRFASTGRDVLTVKADAQTIARVFLSALPSIA